MPRVYQNSSPQHNGANLSYIADDLRHLAVPITSLTFDPFNARVHPDVNIKGIMDSLEQFGQVKPIVVNKRTGQVCAGNGTLQAAIELKWHWIAVVYRDWDDGTTAAFALADNATSDVAQWDMEAKARLVRLIEEAGNKPICVSDDEIMELRTLEFIPPPTDTSEDEDGTGGKTNNSIDNGNGENGGVSFLSENAKEQLAESMVVERAVELCRQIEGNDTLSRSQALYIISHHYLHCSLHQDAYSASEDGAPGSLDGTG